MEQFWSDNKEQTVRFLRLSFVVGFLWSSPVFCEPHSVSLLSDTNSDIQTPIVRPLLGAVVIMTGIVIKYCKQYLLAVQLVRGTDVVSPAY